MAELIIPTDRVRELTTAPTRVPIEIEGSVTHEIVLAIWTSFSPKHTNSAHDLGPEWVEQIRERTSDDLAEELLTLGGPHFYIWLGISSLLLSAPHPHDPDRVFTWLESLDEQRLRRWILGHASHNDDQALIEQAAGGDLDAAVELVGGKDDDVQEEMVAYTENVLYEEGLPMRFADALKRFRSEVFVEHEEEFAGAISRAAAARRAAPTRGTAKEVVEEVTSGIDFEIPRGVTRVVLIPSVVTRPLSLIDVYRGNLVVYYGMADEFIDSDPEAPPSWLIRAYKALSDERRLRILRRMSEGPASLDDLSELLGLSKSTVHHHITILRGAGLVRVHIDKDETSSKKNYSLREQSLADAAGFLDSYLRSTEEQQRHA